MRGRSERSALRQEGATPTYTMHYTQRCSPTLKPKPYGQLGRTLRARRERSALRSALRQEGRVRGLGFGAWDLGFGGWGFGFRVLGFGFRVSGVGSWFMAYGS